MDSTDRELLLALAGAAQLLLAAQANNPANRHGANMRVHAKRIAELLTHYEIPPYPEALD